MAVPARVWIGGVDVSRWVYDLTTSVGFRSPNSIGSVSVGAKARVTFIASKGSPVNAAFPGDSIPVEPGVEVVINVGSRLLLRGFSFGLETSFEHDLQHVSALTVFGALQWIEQYHSEVFTTLDSTARTLRTDELLGILLDEVGWEQDARRLDRGETNLWTIKVKTSGLFRSGRRPVNFKNAMLACAQAEFGRVYDTRDREIVFESRRHRGAIYNIDYTITDRQVGGMSLQKVITKPTGSAVINIVEGNTKGFVSRDNQSIPFTDASDFSTGFVVPAYAIDEKRLTPDLGSINDRTTHIDSYKRLVKGTHYTLSPDNTSTVVSLRTEGGDVLVRVNNITNSASVTMTLIKIEGEPQEEDTGRTIVARNEPSIAIYGRKVLKFPNDLVENEQELRDHIDFLLAVHDGVTPTGDRTDPFHIYQVTVQLEDDHPIISAEPSQTVLLNVPSMGINDVCFIDEVTHDLRNRGPVHRMTLRLVDANATAIWLYEQMKWGVTTRVGF